MFDVWVIVFVYWKVIFNGVLLVVVNGVYIFVIILWMSIYLVVLIVGLYVVWMDIYIDDYGEILFGIYCWVLFVEYMDVEWLFI